MRCLATNRRSLTILDHRKIVFCLNWMRVVGNWLCNLNTLLFLNKKKSNRTISTLCDRIQTDRAYRRRTQHAHNAKKKWMDQWNDYYGTRSLTNSSRNFIAASIVAIARQNTTEINEIATDAINQSSYGLHITVRPLQISIALSLVSKWVCVCLCLNGNLCKR